MRPYSEMISVNNFKSWSNPEALNIVNRAHPSLRKFKIYNDKAMDDFWCNIIPKLLEVNSVFKPSRTG